MVALYETQQKWSFPPPMVYGTMVSQQVQIVPIKKEDMVVQCLGNLSTVIEFLSTIPLVIHQSVQESLAWLFHWFNLIHYMDYLPKNILRT